MKFGPLTLDEAEGVILAHSVEVGGKRLRKAHVLTAADIAGLRRSGATEVIAAVLEPGDIGENEAAQVIVDAFAKPGISPRRAATGRVNLHADAPGLFDADVALIDAMNAIDPSITIATLARFSAVDAGQMVATVKIIPYAVPGAAVEKVAAICRGKAVIRVDAFKPAKIGLVQTELAGTKSSVLDKTAKITGQRLERSGSRIGAEIRVSHDAGAVAGALAQLHGGHDMLLVFGASAVSDDQDVIPDAIRRAGGRVLRTGMPVDPGNLLVLGELNGKTVIGAPGCARSPKENGFDWVLDRALSGRRVSDADIAGMGVGGLLMEIVSRPQPREADAENRQVKVHGIVLAAGRSSRMRGPNKLMAEFDGLPLIRRTVDQVMASKAAAITVVVGHQNERIVEALKGAAAGIAQNPDFAEGLSSSLKAGIAGVRGDASGALIVLGDMPGIGAADLDQMIDAFRHSGGVAIVRATHNGKRGNPVILPRSLFSAVATLQGDTGARHLIEADDGEVVDIELGEAASVDVDTPDAMTRAGGVLKG